MSRLNELYREAMCHQKGADTALRYAVSRLMRAGHTEAADLVFSILPEDASAPWVREAITTMAATQ